MVKPKTPTRVLLIMQKPLRPPSSAAKVSQRAQSPPPNVSHRAPSPDAASKSYHPPTPPRSQRQRQVQEQANDDFEGPQLVFHPNRPIIFNGEIGAKIIVTTKIKNRTNSFVPYTIKVSDGDMFRVSPATGYLNPKESREVKILYTGVEVGETDHIIALFARQKVSARLEIQFVLFAPPLWTEETVQGLVEAMKLYRYPNATYTVVRKGKKVEYEGRWVALAAHLTDRFNREYSPEQVRFFVESTNKQDLMNNVTSNTTSRAESVNDDTDDVSR